jgi:hypothetical protein
LVVVVLVSIETLILVLLSMLVAGLLRSHAEILRRLGDTHEEPSSRVISMPGPSLPIAGHDRANGRSGRRAPDIAGTTLQGDPMKIAPDAGGRSSLVAFLSSGCSTCREFWDALQPPVRQSVPGDARLIVVTRDSSHESPSRLRDLAPGDLPLVMSSAAWAEYEVPMTPYFVYVEGSTGKIAGEGAAEAWPQIISLVRDALGDAQLALARTADQMANGASSNGVARLRRADDELRAAGISPGHPSLYAAGDPSAR